MQYKSEPHIAARKRFDIGKRRKRGNALRVCLLSLSLPDDPGKIPAHQVQDDHGDRQEEVPVVVGKDLVEEIQRGIGKIGRIDGEHVADLDHLAVEVQELGIVDGQIHEVNEGICAKGDAEGGLDALGIQLDQPQLEHHDRDTDLQDVREVEEVKGPTEQYHLLGAVRQGHQGKQRSEGPQQKKVARRFVLGPYREGKGHSVQRAEVKGKILERSAPGDEIVYDGGPPRKGQNAQNDVLRFFACPFQTNVQNNDHEDTGDQRSDMYRPKKSPKRHSNLLHTCEIIQPSAKKSRTCKTDTLYHIIPHLSTKKEKPLRFLLLFSTAPRAYQ